MVTGPAIALCDDQAVPRPPTGKTPLRNVRSPDEVWLPALARATAEDVPLTDVINERLRDYGRIPGFDFDDRPDAPGWLEANYPEWRDCADALIDAIGGYVTAEYIGVALWLAITRNKDVRQQKRVVAGFLLGRADSVRRGGWRQMYADKRGLLAAVTAVLDTYLP